MNVQPNYYWTLWWMPLLVFLVALVAFHLLLVYSPWRLSTRSWKKVDYIWLSMSLVGIIGLVSQARQAINISFLPLAESLVHYAATDISDTLKDAAHLTCDFKFTKDELSPPNFDEAVVQNSRYCDYIKRLTVSFGPALNSYAPIKHDFAQDESYPLAYGYDFQQPRLETLVNQFNRHIEQRDDIKADTQRSDVDIYLAMFGPYLIAIAPSLRMTKVTADLRTG